MQVKKRISPRKQPTSRFMDNPKYVKMMSDDFTPIPVSGPKPVPAERRVLWKNVCLVGVASIKESQLEIQVR